MCSLFFFVKIKQIPSFSKEYLGKNIKNKGEYCHKSRRITVLIFCKIKDIHDFYYFSVFLFIELVLDFVL